MARPKRFALLPSFSGRAVRVGRFRRCRVQAALTVKYGIDLITSEKLLQTVTDNRSFKLLVLS
jgi:hypothetical protein